MDDAEAGRLLRACGLRLHTDSVRLLVEHTEGWPAALYLAALSLSAADDADRAAEKFAGDDRVVVDYLRDEFVSSLSGVELDFLTRTSILDEVSGELCDAVLEAEGSAEILRGLARSNALVRRLDNKDNAFRYHALLRDMLASELRRLHGGEESALHSLAAEWYASAATSTAPSRTRSPAETAMLGGADLVAGSGLRQRRARRDLAALDRVLHTTQIDASPPSASSARPRRCRAVMSPPSPIGRLGP